MNPVVFFVIVVLILGGIGMAIGAVLQILQSIAPALWALAAILIGGVLIFRFWPQPKPTPNELPPPPDAPLFEVASFMSAVRARYLRTTYRPLRNDYLNVAYDVIQDLAATSRGIDADWHMTRAMNFLNQLTTTLPPQALEQKTSPSPLSINSTIAREVAFSLFFNAAQLAYGQGNLGGNYGQILNRQLPDVTLRSPFEIPEQLRFEGAWIVAPRGRGKTNLLRNLVEADRKKKGCVILIDAKGELIDCYRDKAIVIEPSLTNPPQINPLDLGSPQQTVELMEYIFASILGNELARVQQTLFHQVVALAITIPDANITTISDILSLRDINDDPDVAHFAKSLPDESDRKFFFYDFKDRLYQDRKVELKQRFYLLTRNPYIKAMFNVRKTTLDIGRLMDGQNLVVIDNTYDDEIWGETGSELFGRFMLALVRSAAYKRSRIPDEHKNPVYLYIDEAHVVIRRDESVHKLLNQCRAQKIACTFANQAMSQIELDAAKNALLDCPIFMVNPRNEAAAWLSRLNLERAGVDALKNLPTHTFAAYVDTQTASAVNVTVPWLSLPMTKRKPPEPPPSHPPPPRPPPTPKPASESTPTSSPKAKRQPAVHKKAPEEWG